MESPRRDFRAADDPKVPPERERSLKTPLDAKSERGSILTLFPIWDDSTVSTTSYGTENSFHSPCT
jgi:hypothetical protein